MVSKTPATVASPFHISELGECPKPLKEPCSALRVAPARPFSVRPKGVKTSLKKG